MALDMDSQQPLDTVMADAVDAAEAKRQYMRQYNAQRSEKMREYNAARRKDPVHKAMVYEGACRYRKRNPDKYREYQREYQRKYYWLRKERQALVGCV